MPIVDSITVKCQISNTTNKQKFRTDFPLKAAVLTTVDPDVASTLEYFGLHRGKNKKEGDPEYFFCKCSTNMDLYTSKHTRNKTILSGKAKDNSGDWTDNFKSLDPETQVTILKIETESGTISYKIKNILAPSGLEYIRRDNPFAESEGEVRTTPDSTGFMNLNDVQAGEDDLPFN